jgi:hypothetical protein
MLLWIILVLGWLAVLLLALALFRLAGYTERKVRRLARPVAPGKEQENQTA